MLNGLESHLLEAIAAAEPPDLTIRSGPVFPPDGRSEAEQLAVSVHSLESTQSEHGERGLEGREPAFLSQRLVFAADGQQLDFLLDEATTGRVAEIQAPPGKLARAGDDYQIAGRKIQFYRPPPRGEEGVLVWLAGAESQGYRERTPCQADVEVVAWAKESATADRLLEPALAAALASFVDLDLISLHEDEQSDVRLQLLRPVAHFNAVERSAEQIGAARFFRSAAHLRVRGELELTVALGEAAPEGRIAHIDYVVDSSGQ